MKTYYYSVEHKSKEKDKNRTIYLYKQMKDKTFFHIGEMNVNTSSYKGDYAVACEIASIVKGHRISDNGYELKSKNIKFVQLPQ